MCNTVSQTPGIVLGAQGLTLDVFVEWLLFLTVWVCFGRAEERDFNIYVTDNIIVIVYSMQ